MPTLLQATPEDNAGILAASKADIVCCSAIQARSVSYHGLASSRLAIIADLSEDSTAALEAASDLAPWGVVLRGAEHGSDLVRLSAQLAVAEAMGGLDEGTTRTVAVIETPAALTEPASFCNSGPRLTGLAWDAAGLARRLGSFSPRYLNGDFAPPFAMARSLCLLTAKSAGVPAIDTICEDDDLFETECEEALFQGFTGKLARSETQVRIVSDIFK